MRKTAALIWIALVVAAALHLGYRANEGIRLDTDLLALLPHEEQDTALRHAKARVSAQLSRQVLIMPGHVDRQTARQAAERLSTTLGGSGLFEDTPSMTDPNAIERLGRIYFPYRHGLLSEADRQRLLDGRGKEISDRALAQVFGFIGIGDANLLRADPFLLLPSFLAELPAPMSRIAVDDGMLSVRDNGKTWILLSYRLKGEAYALDVQKRLTRVLAKTLAELRVAAPEVEARRLGAVFFAHAGAESAMGEATRISIVAIVSVVILVLVVFRALAPLWQSLLAIGVGVLCAVSFSLIFFDRVHVVALLFGSTLIGTTVDYSMHYCCEVFDADDSSPLQRLTHVLPALSLGAATTVIGYSILFLAPFTGLRQIAAISVVGMLASFATVVLWLPFLDRRRTVIHGNRYLLTAAHLWRFWQSPERQRSRIALLAILAALGIAGLARISSLDDIRRMQTLSPDLMQEQEDVQNLTGRTASSQYYLVRATDHDTALVRGEKLVARLRTLQAEHAVGGFLSPAQFVPSAARQRENARLVAERLEAQYLSPHLARLGLPAAVPPETQAGDVLTLQKAAAGFSVLRNLVLSDEDEQVIHVILLDHPTGFERLRSAANGIEGVTFIDPVADFTGLFGKYRRWAIVLLAVSAALMFLALAWRYRLRGALRVMFPPVAGVTLAPAILALGGHSFSFFDAMALILTLAIGVDYAIFCAEATRPRRPLTLLAVTLATLTSLLSFGLLSFSQTFAVHAFGLTMLAGIALVYLLSPLAADGRKHPTEPAQ